MNISHSDRQAILVVEDEFLIRMMATELFEDAGFEVLEAANADEGLVMLEKRPDIAALFTDVEMPGKLNGYTLASKARASNPNLAVIIVSGRQAPAAGELPIGGRFITKPYDANSVVNGMRDILKSKRPD